MRTFWLLAAVLLCVSGCAAQAELALPMTAAQAVREVSVAALVAYLGQPDANPAVCDPAGTGAHVPGLPADARTTLVDGMRAGKVPPALGRRCINRLAKGLPADDSASLFDAMALAYRDMLTSSHLDTDPRLVERLTALHQLYLDRKPGLGGHPTVVLPLVASLHQALAQRKLGPVATYFASELLETIDLEHGTWQGRPVDVATMDALAAAGNEVTLGRFAERLPSDDLRAEARRRIVRVHVALSPFPEVRTAGPALDAAMLKDGVNAISIADHPVVRAWLDEKKTPPRTVVVRQDVFQRTATLLGRWTGRLEVSVLPELPLRDRLLLQVQSIARPVGVCAEASDLDPSPCVGVTDLSIDQALTTLDRSGSVHVRDDVNLDEVLPLASEGAFRVPVRVAGRPATTVEWGLWFERPKDVVFRGEAPGGVGPALSVRITLPRASRFRFDARTSEPYVAVVEGADVTSFRVSSRGGAGEDGSTGSTGSTGSSGGTCQSGGRGGNGGPGGDGGPGGTGGEVLAQIVCSPGACETARAALAGVVRSEGGPGGDGGSGGSGGAGGSGGPSRSATSHTDSNGNTVVDDPGCSAGSTGPSGSDGPSGSAGPDGKPGHVVVQIVGTGLVRERVPEQPATVARP